MLDRDRERNRRLSEFEDSREAREAQVFAIQERNELIQEEREREERKVAALERIASALEVIANIRSAR